MQKIKIGVVEDEIIIADRICSTLLKLGYAVTNPVVSFNRAVKMMEEEKPDLFLLDIELAGQKDGIELAQYIKHHYPVPFIFLTANSDKETIARAAKVQPYAYLVKPFTAEELFASIEIALSTFNDRQAAEKNPVTASAETSKDYIFIKDGSMFHKVYFSNIIYIESEENYVALHTTDSRKLMTRSTFNDFLKQFETHNFFRTHRSFSINPSFVEGVDQAYVLMKGGAKVPFSRGQKEELMKVLGIG
jgi:DNA-binding LytR/AlgR family response regulator